MKTALDNAIFVVPTASRGLIPVDYKKYSNSIELGNLGGQKNKLCPFYRAKFSDWNCKVLVVFDEDVISSRQLVKAVLKAGIFGGIGAWRAAKSGTYGTYTITKIGSQRVRELVKYTISKIDWAQYII